MDPGVVRDVWLEMWMQRNRDQRTAGEAKGLPQFAWRTEDVKARLREVAVLLDAIKHATEVSFSPSAVVHRHFPRTAPHAHRTPHTHTAHARTGRAIVPCAWV